MIAPIKQPERRVGSRRSKPGLARAHRWISKTLLIETPVTREDGKIANRTWVIIAWIVLVGACYFGRMIAEFIATR